MERYIDQELTNITPTKSKSDQLASEVDDALRDVHGLVTRVSEQNMKLANTSTEYIDEVYEMMMRLEDLNEVRDKGTRLRYESIESKVRYLEVYMKLILKSVVVITPVVIITMVLIMYKLYF